MPPKIKSQTKNLPKDMSLGERIVTVGEVAALFGLARQTVDRWVREEDSPFNRDDGSQHAKCDLATAIRWVYLRLKTKYNDLHDIKLPSKRERTPEALEEALWNEAINGRGASKIKANEDLRKIMEARGEGLPEEITIELAVLAPADKEYHEIKQIIEMPKINKKAKK